MGVDFRDSFNSGYFVFRPPETQMNKYEVTIKGTKIKQIIKAQTSLEARVIFCSNRKLNYIIYANKLAVKLLD